MVLTSHFQIPRQLQFGTRRPDAPRCFSIASQSWDETEMELALQIDRSLKLNQDMCARPILVALSTLVLGVVPPGEDAEPIIDAMHTHVLRSQWPTHLELRSS